MALDDKTKIEALRGILWKAGLLLRRVSLRYDNPPKWAEEAKGLADGIEAVLAETGG